MFKNLFRKFIKKDILHEDYVLSLKDFKNNLTDMVENTEDKEPLYNKDFTISFNGLSVKIGFGATEFYAIKKLLDQIIEEQE